MIAEWITLVMVVYFLALNTIHLLLTLLAARALVSNQHFREMDQLPMAFSLLSPPISVLVPAFNEAKTIVATVESLLQLNHPEFEVVVINDGSKDETLQVLQQHFALLPYPEAYRIQLPTQVVKAIYCSSLFPNLRVIDKDNGGKADSLNAGINAARYPLFCGVDADSILQRDSLQKVVKPFLHDPTMVATGGTIRVANGCHVRGGDVRQVDLPRNPWALFQVMEYLRAFLLGRLGWSSLNAMLIISGAFGVFRKQTVIDVGGYKTRTIGEDMELVVRIHHHMRSTGQAYRIEFVPDPVCWTEAPEDRQTLRNQRIRWQRGLSESLSSHWGLMFSRRGGWVGWLAFPYMVLFEWLGPLIELAGYIWTLYAWWAGFLSGSSLVLFACVSLGMGIALSVMSVLLEQISFQMYPYFRQTLKLTAVAFLENLGYRQLAAWWRLVGLYRWATQSEGSWGAMTRKGHKPSSGEK